MEVIDHLNNLQLSGGIGETELNLYQFRDKKIDRSQSAVSGPLPSEPQLEPDEQRLRNCNSSLHGAALLRLRLEAAPAAEAPAAEGEEVAPCDSPDRFSSSEHSRQGPAAHHHQQEAAAVEFSFKHKDWSKDLEVTGELFELKVCTEIATIPQ